MKRTRKVFATVIALAIVVCSILALAVPAAAATTGFDILSSSKYAKTYTLATSGRTIPYTNQYLSTRGTVNGKSSSAYIDNASDELYIKDVGCTNGTYWARVSYPTSSKRVDAYIPLSVLTKNNGNHAKTTSTGKFYCSLREGWGTGSSYYVAKGDTVYLIATSGSKYQILYPISGGWRLAWCNASDYQKYCGTTTSNNTTVIKSTTNNASGMVDVTSYFAGRTIAIQSVQNGQYMCADRNLRDVPLMCNRANRTNWTTFTVSSMTSDGWVAIQANSNGRYLTAVNNATNTPVRAYASQLLSWECFRIYMKGSDFYLKAQVNGKFLCARIDLSGTPVQACASVADGWERFSIRFIDETQYVSATELVSTAVSYGLSANSNAYKALCSMNGKYATKLSSSQKQGTSIFMFEGVGNNSSSSSRRNAMCVVVKNGDIVYLNRNCSTIPDYPFTPSKNEGTAMPTLKSGIYSFTTVNHRNKYAALNIKGAQVVRFSSKTSYYSSTSGAINVHRRDSNNIAPSSAGWVNSAGCLLIGQSGTASNSEYAAFIKAVGIVGSRANGNSKYSTSRTGTIVVDRSYAGSYLSNVGYSASAIRAIG